MTIETSAPRSRRALLAGGLGGLGALVAAGLGRPTGVAATDGDAMLVGNEHTASSVTKVSNPSSADTVLEAVSTWGDAVHATGANAGVGLVASGGTGIMASSTFGTAIDASSTNATCIEASSTSGTGIHVSSESGDAIRAFSDSWSGIYAESQSHYAVYGLGPTGGGVYGLGGLYGVRGASGNGYGVYGYSDSNHGVFGESDASSAPGVMGRSPGQGTGVLGYSGTNPLPSARAATGVYGVATSGTGIRGQATTGTAGYFATTSVAAGLALRAVGRVKLDTCAGVTMIPVGQKSVVVTPGIDLVSTSAVVATLMGSAGGTTNVHRVAVNATTNTFTIVLTANNTATSPVKVAWHVFG